MGRSRAPKHYGMSDTAPLYVGGTMINAQCKSQRLRHIHITTVLLAVELYCRSTSRAARAHFYLKCFQKKNCVLVDKWGKLIIMENVR